MDKPWWRLPATSLMGCLAVFVSTISKFRDCTCPMIRTSSPKCQKVEQMNSEKEEKQGPPSLSSAEADSCCLSCFSSAVTTSNQQQQNTARQVSFLPKNNKKGGLSSPHKSSFQWRSLSFSTVRRSALKENPHRAELALNAFKTRVRPYLKSEEENWQTFPRENAS